MKWGIIMATKRGLGRRPLVRLISFTVALIVALTATSVTSYVMAKDYRRSIEYTFQRALSELTEYVNDLNVTLNKGQYATTPKQLQGISTKLWQDAGYAKSSLAHLPVNEGEISATSKFLSQVGNFCLTLADRVSEGDSITDADLETLDKLSDYASQVSEQLRQMVSDLESGRLKLGEVKTEFKKEGEEKDTITVDSGFKEIEESFTDYPTMIYDGPFSDHILQQQPKFIKGKGQVSVDKALQIAKEATDIATLKHAGDTNGNLPAYDFTSETTRISVTKAGGVVEYFLDSRPVGEPTLSNGDAIKRAEKALADMGFNQFKYRYYALNSGVLTVNFAATQNGVILYPDLIKVGIALDDGSVVSYDAKGYIMNHTTREFTMAKVSEQEARGILSKRLTVKSHAMALVPSDSLSETLCHEFLCVGENDEQVLAYVNVETGMEEQILIIIEDEMGVLAM
mgnify:CR=1 FL=1